jgi:hypothetical protein
MRVFLASLMATGIKVITLMGPDGQQVEINRNEIVSTRAPRSTDHFGKGVRCLVFTVDGKYIGVIETCAEVRRLWTEEGRG